ncbi:MAG TPA: alpha-amylase family protein [Xanthobacteraceae bacterium]|nr:alpha-amylase family protein [Xanthobacteraceae bacterium]
MINDLWYKNAVIYCLSVGTYMDADGDGIGDFTGLLRRLDYLNGLGVTAIWLMPFQTSPHRDDGYDVSDYYNVDPRYGTLGDFVEFAHGAKQRGMRVLIDLVVNHTSDQHPWFKEARKDPNSKYRDWYVWSKAKPRNADKGVVFPGVQKSTWSYDSEAKAWYFHRFYDFQPDLNTSNPMVQAEILKIMGFWVQQGVSGFRMDAVPFVISTKGPQVTKPEEQYDILRRFREFLQWRQGDLAVLAEANVLPETDMEYFGEDGERLQMMFNFQVNQNLFYALAAADSRPLAKAMQATKPRPATAQWGQFLRNHDELDLGRLTDAQRQKVFAEFAPDPGMQLYDRGIRRRLAPMLKGDRRRIEMAYSLMFTLPGTPVVRYGDELGMGDDLSLPERNCARTPMQWSNEPHGGFTKSSRPVTPVISGGPYGYEQINAAIQRRHPDSPLNWTERIIRMRKEVPEIGWGDFSVIPTGDHAVLVMRYDWRNNSVLFVHNLDGKPREIVFAVGLPPEKEEQGRLLVNLLSEDHSRAAKDGRHRLVIEPYGYRWYRVGGLDYLLRRSEIDEAPPEASARQPRKRGGGGHHAARDRRRRTASAKSRR